MSETLKRDGLYPCGEFPHGFGVRDLREIRDIRATPTGEKRPPKKGEWYLSGSIIEAYQAKSDLSTSYYIAKLVRTRTFTVTEIVK